MDAPAHLRIKGITLIFSVPQNRKYNRNSTRCEERIEEMKVMKIHDQGESGVLRWEVPSLAYSYSLLMHAS